MTHVQTQHFYERHTGDKHDVTILFGWNSAARRGHYTVKVDGEFYSDHESKLSAFYEVVDIIKANNWTSINPI